MITFQMIIIDIKNNFSVSVETVRRLKTCQKKTGKQTKADENLFENVILFWLRIDSLMGHLSVY